MGSKSRQEAIASGKIVENAESIRRRRRHEATVARDEFAIRLYAQGKKVAEIEDALFDEFGVRMHGNLLAMIRRGLARRVEQGSQDAKIARELMLAQYRQLLEVYMPRALGQIRDPDTGLMSTPDPRAADLALKVLDKAGIILGVVAPPRSDINVNVGIMTPPDADTARRLAAENLARDRAKLLEIEGQLGDTPAVEGGERTGDDIPPPFDLPATPD